MLANLVLQTADQERMTTPNLDWSHLASDFEDVINRCLVKSHPGSFTEQELADERASYVSGLRECVRRMCELGLLNQG